MSPPSPPPYRVGAGSDTHRVARDSDIAKPLLLGGVEVPVAFHLVGHSDADVLAHAVTDAILGACGAGDIGELFPNTDPANAGRDSADFLREAVRQAADRGWRIGNLDCTVHAERPKLSEFKQPIAARLAELLGVSPDVVNVKAKSGEAVGPVGRGEALTADAVVLLFRDER
ncbi:2-C-methyl-D-erythritol 2,4-cyclodiphosphate synthase [Alienimonas californiensis]|uniref:2-C-methyl-D-erythritol 2,4-cyclodiphosphate synthase n=1 Tax=Alienimonas californiensis TaxID=2527989 RepID=A0A517PFS0_9PLAN|nr:2-C-methyl-D-erythritol 2,4-cyclodiphosphate synthase [Alienimonas californiensis]QDT18194.1 2-C-methyl-D-erythritol 2,4-cyclodiphosphate synthase [Alienimonas californiensis]